MRIREKFPRTVPLVLLFVFTLLLFSAARDLDKRQQAVSALIEAGIYEVDYTYFFQDRSTVVVYMICDPPAETRALEVMVRNFLTPQRLAEFSRRAGEYAAELEAADGRDRPIRKIWAMFLEPSPEFGVGFFPEPHRFTDYEQAKDHIIAHAFAGPDHKGEITVSLTIRE